MASAADTTRPLWLDRNSRKIAASDRADALGKIASCGARVLPCDRKVGTRAFVPPMSPARIISGDL